MNRTLKEATVKRYHYDSHDQLRQHLRLFLDAYNHARRLKTLHGLTPYEYIASMWTKKPQRFKYDPYRFSPGLNIYPAPIIPIFLKRHARDRRVSANGDRSYLLRESSA